MPKVGGEVDSKCGKCKDDTLHIVLAMVGDAIAKVQCKRCDAQHRYRAPDHVKAKAKRGVKTPKAARKGATPKKGKGGRQKYVEPLKVDPNLDEPVRPYTMSDRFETGDRIQHKKFGVGVVETSVPGKIEVFFEGERKTLRQAP